MQSIRDKAYMPVLAEKRQSNRIKISIIGCGQVGMVTALSLLLKGIPSEIALLDMDTERVECEIQDLAAARLFFPKAEIYGGTNFKLTSNSNIVIVCTGVPKGKNETKANLVQRNVDSFKRIIPHIVENSPKSLIIILTKPVDVMAYVAWRISGFPKNRVFGLGTFLDTNRLRIAVGQKLGLSPSAVHAYMFGEQGENSVPIWSSAAVSGTRLRSIHPELGTHSDTQGFANVHKELLETEEKLLQAKGSLEWSTGLATTHLCEAVLGDSDQVITISTHAKHEGKLQGMQGIDKDIFMSLPCIINNNGVRGIMWQQLDDDEKERLFTGAKKLEELIQSIEW